MAKNLSEVLPSFADLLYATRKSADRYADSEDLDRLRQQVTSQMPSKVSDLRNDAGYQTAAQVQEKLDAASIADRAYTDETADNLQSDISDAVNTLRKPDPTTLTVPITGWLSTQSMYYCDIAVPELTPSAHTDVSINDTDVQSQEAADDCGLMPYVQTLAGKLRVFATNIPTKPITIHVTYI